MTYKTSHYVLGELSPETEPQKAMTDIVFMVKDMLSSALCNKATGLDDVHPKTLIAMVASNIIVNLLITAIGDTDFKTRLKMAQDCITEVQEMSLHLWKAIEANRANDTTAH